MIKIENQEHFDKIKAFAESVGALDELQAQLDYLASYGVGDTCCDLHYDFAPHSFAFTMYKRVNGEYKRWFNGGLIYRGPGSPHDGSMPALTVAVNPSDNLHSWSVNT